MAERVLRLRLDQLTRGAEAFSLSSAGVRALAGHPMDASSAAELERIGGDPAGFVSAQLTASMVESAGLVLTATVDLRSRVLAESPRALRRTFTLREFAALVADAEPASDPVELVAAAAQRRGRGSVAEYDLPDPIGRPAPVHREVADLVEESSSTIARALAASVGSPAP